MSRLSRSVDTTFEDNINKMNKIATVLLCINFITVLFPQPGYIHPDEFFQSTEVVAGDVFNVTHYRAWEFDPDFPLRSIVFPYALSYPPLYLLEILNSTNWSGLQISTVKVVMSTRLPLAFLSVLGYLATGKLADTFYVDKRLSTVLYCSSYVTWTYFTRTFSNSVESVLMAIILLLTMPGCVIQDHVKVSKTKTTKAKDQGGKESYEGHTDDESSRKVPGKIESCQSNQDCIEKNCFLKPFCFGVVVAAGIFNRPTFVVFAFIPIILWLFMIVHPLQLGWFSRLVSTSFSLVCGGFISCLTFVVADTVYYKSNFLPELKMFFHLLMSGEMSLPDIQKHISILSSNVVITPLNFVLYNSDSSNLAKHGLHPHSLHVFVNLPLLLGPVYIAFLYVTATTSYQFLRRRQCSERNPGQPMQFWLVLMAIVPVLALSMFPHQEPRFLIPALPIFMVMGAKLVSAMAPARLSFMAVWIFFNVFLTIVYGYMHQGALIPAMSIYQQKLSAIASKPVPSNYHAIFYKTYPPPRHLLLLSASSSHHVHIHDLQGGPVPSVRTAVLDSKAQCKKVKGSCQIFLFMPATVTARVDDLLSKDFKLQATSICPHLSMEATPRVMACWRKKISFDEFIMEFCLNIIKIT